jgi:hypothetical protein|tara:strand:+ start:204 stop:683 length:480 start_codon:yes stop_codon:yes gene_type:complete
MKHPVKNTREYKRFKAIMKFAPEMLEQDGFHAPFMFLLCKGKQGVIPLDLETDKDQMVAIMRGIAGDSKADACLVITEVWVAEFGQDGAMEEFRESGLAVRDYEKKTEALSMTWEIKMDDEVVRGLEMIPFHREDDNIVLGKKQKQIGEFEGRFVGILS